MESRDSGDDKGLANHWISVELRTDTSISARFMAFIRGLIYTYIFFSAEGSAPRTHLLLLDRATGRPIHVQDWGYDYQAAVNAKGTFEGDLRSLDVATFCGKYFIDWRPSGRLDIGDG